MAWKGRRAQLRGLAEGLVKAGSLQFGTFTLPDGEESSYYINLRGLPSYPGVYGLVVDAVAELAAGKTPKADAFCAVPMNGLAIAAPVAVRLNKPLAYLREPKPGEKVLEGEVMPDWNVVVVDDLATSGNTVLNAAKAVEQEGGVVSHAIVVIDRLEGARERLSKQGISLHAVTDVVELADTLFSMELITKENLKAITRTVGARA
jgi:orotate phosphoribosyltransferase